MISDFQLLYTRISHDLAGIGGALYNGAELIGEAPECLEEALPVLTESSQDLIGRLRFFRQTFGVPAEKTEDATALYLKTLSKPIDLVGVCETQIQKMLVMTLSDLMFWGGSIVVTEDKIVGKFQRISQSVSLLKDIFAGKKEGVSEQNISARMAYLFANEKNKHIEISEKDNEITLKILSKD